MRAVPVVALLLLGTVAAPAQWIRRGKAQPGPTTKVAAVVEGTIHTISKKEIGLEREGDNVMVLSIGRKTKFERDGKTADWKAFHSGDEVTVQTDEDFPGHFAALRISMKSSPADKQLIER